MIPYYFYLFIYLFLVPNIRKGYNWWIVNLEKLLILLSPPEWQPNCVATVQLWMDSLADVHRLHSWVSSVRLVIKIFEPDWCDYVEAFFPFSFLLSNSGTTFSENLIIVYDQTAIVQSLVWDGEKKRQNPRQPCSACLVIAGVSNRVTPAKTA